MFHFWCRCVSSVPQSLYDIRRSPPDVIKGIMTKIISHVLVLLCVLFSRKHELQSIDFVRRL